MDSAMRLSCRWVMRLLARVVFLLVSATTIALPY